MLKLVQSRIGETGTCFRTALASILNLQESDVPDFPDANEDPYVNTFLAKHGLRYEELPYVEGEYPAGLYLLLGVSPRGGMHVVIEKDGKLVWDTHPMDNTGRGISEPLRYGVLTKATQSALDMSGYKYGMGKRCHLCGVPVNNGQKVNECQACRLEKHYEGRLTPRIRADAEGIRKALRKAAAKDAIDVSKKAFIAELNSHGYKHSHANNKYGNRKRAYGSYLYNQDREKFNVDYEEWRAEKLKSQAKDHLHIGKNGKLTYNDALTRNFKKWAESRNTAKDAAQLSGKRLNYAAEKLYEKHDDIDDNLERQEWMRQGGPAIAAYNATHGSIVSLVREAKALRKHAQDTTIARATPAQLQARINNLRIKNTPGVSAQIEALERLLKIKAEWARAKDSALETKPSMTDLLSTLGIDIKEFMRRSEAQKVQLLKTAQQALRGKAKDGMAKIPSDLELEIIKLQQRLIDGEGSPAERLGWRREIAQLKTELPKKAKDSSSSKRARLHKALDRVLDAKGGSSRARDFDPAFAIKVAADNIAKLRKQDVFRVLEQTPYAQLDKVVQYIKYERPDLAQEAVECAAEIRAAAKDSALPNPVQCPTCRKLVSTNSAGSMVFHDKAGRSVSDPTGPHCAGSGKSVGAKDAEDPRMIQKQFFDLLRKAQAATKDKYGRISFEHAKQLKAIAAPYGAAYVSSPVEGRKTLPSPAHLSRTVRELYVIPEKRGESSHPFEKK